MIETYAALPLLFWVLGSVLIYAVGTNAWWYLHHTKTRGSLAGSELVQVGRFLFFLAIPYLAAGGWPRRPLQGLLSLKDLGLVTTTADWPIPRLLGSFSMGLGVGLLALIVLLLAWRSAYPMSRGEPLFFPQRSWWMLLVDGIYLQVHWAFYRTGIIIVREDLYAGVFLGLGLVYVEWALSPFWRKGWQERSQAAVRWLRAALAFTSAIIFLLTRNLWACLLVHWSLEFFFWHLGRRRERALEI